MTILQRDFTKGRQIRLSGSIEKGMSDTELLDMVQWHTSRYFSEFSHPASGMARERSNFSPAYDYRETVTAGGTGFGIMALIVAAERGWLPRERLVDQIGKITDFLTEAPTYHGVFPHFMNGRSGKTIAFGKNDDGGDVVETSFLMMGLLAAREYLRPSHPNIVGQIDNLWLSVKWQHYIPEGRKDLHWHWSAASQFDRNLPVQGWNECLLTHVLAASSPTYPLDPDIYHASWARGADFFNGKKYNGIELQLGPDRGGPLFFAHYSFMGIDPRGLQDRYADYWEQNCSHVLINRAYCLDNPHHRAGYGEACWGLTASDGVGGYADHSPLNDRGVISPTAALSSFPYTPEYSMQALRYFYEEKGGQIWRHFGFADAFHPGKGWVAPGHLAIDQAPIVCMIENYRSGLLWNLFMSCPEVQNGLKALGFKSPHLEKVPAIRANGPDSIRPVA